ncbi:MAG: dihydropteroate synthase [Pseudomonadota bacterium]
MTGVYYRPVASIDPVRPAGALSLAGGWAWWDRAERITRDGQSDLIAAADVPEEVRIRLSVPRAPIAGLSFDTPRLMGILNTTPDSFSDGGQHAGQTQAVAHAKAMAAAGADILDIGGESTRPGADVVPDTEEITRTAPVIENLRNGSVDTPISIDTRKAVVGTAGLAAGANIINDVSALTYDTDLGAVAARAGGLCLMHAQGDPKTMQADPRYDDVLLDVYDYLEARVAAAEAAGVPRDRIIVDPGIGFGKTIQHNLTLVRGISLFHGLGCPILLGVSRKGFIGVIGGAQDAATRAPGSIALGLAALAQGVQILRVHDVVETRQAVALWQATHMGWDGGWI